MTFATDFDDAFAPIWIAQSTAPANHCEHAPQCTGARIAPQGSTDPMACEAVEAIVADQVDQAELETA